MVYNRKSSFVPIIYKCINDSEEQTGLVGNIDIDDIPDDVFFWNGRPKKVSQ